MSHEIFTAAELNGPKTVVGYPDLSFKHTFPEKPKSVFEVVALDSPPALVEFLRFAEREGVYGKLSLRARRAIEMRYVEGLGMSQIGDVLGISKQAVSQGLRLAPESLYKKMTKDVFMRRTNTPFSKILSVYSAYRVELDAKRKGKE